MKAFLFISVLLCAGAPICAYSQTTKELARFIISDARINKKDNTAWITAEGGYIVFYISEGGNFCMANVVPKANTQSYGKLYNSTHETGTVYETYPADIFTYNWSYQNSYDTKNGTAHVVLIKIYKPQGVAFVCNIVTEGLDEIEYRGYMNGTIDFSQF